MTKFMSMMGFFSKKTVNVKTNLMKYKSQGKQLTFEAFRSFWDNLLKSNRWVRVGDELP